MATLKLSPQDRKDLDKFTKYLVFKCAQIIIQSRSGEKVNTPSKLVSSGTDWFNLSIRDDPEIQTEIKNIYGNSSLIDGEKVCFEISVKTSGGEETVLETWYLEATDHCDLTSRISCSVYARMGVLLRSLLIVTRAIPAYWVSREQAQDRYVMCYRIYLGTPLLTGLGEQFVRRTVGLVPSPVGTIALHAAYRLKKGFSVKHHLADVLAKDFCDNHYRSESVAIGCKGEICCAKSETSAAEKEPAGDKELRRRSAADVTSEDRRRAGSHKTNCIGQVKQSKAGAVERKNSETDSRFPKIIPCTLRSLSKTAADKCDGKEIEADKCGDAPSPTEIDSTNKAVKKSPEQEETSPDGASEHQSSGTVPALNHFDIDGGKSGGGHGEKEPVKMYDGYKTVPPLAMFEQITDVKEMLHCLRRQLQQFEANAKEFDNFVNSITKVVD